MNDERELLEGLKPCPFCGRYSTIFRKERLTDFGMYSHTVRCYRCGANGPKTYGYDDSLFAKERAARRWNGRANDESGN